MSATNQVVSTVPVRTKEEEEEHEESKKCNWSVRVYKYNVPYWVILLVVVVVVVAVCWQTGWCCNKQKVAFAAPTGLTPGAPMLTSASSSSFGSEKVRQELRALFEQF